MTATATAAIHAAIIIRYVEQVRSNGTVDDVLYEIRTGDDEWEVVYELLQVTWDLGFRHDGETETTQDAWWDAMQDALPAVAEALA